MSIPKKKPSKVDDPELLAELGDVPMTDEAISKMSLNPYDQLFICRLLNLRDEAKDMEMEEKLKRFIEGFWKTAAEHISNLYAGIGDQLAAQNKSIDKIQATVTSVKEKVEGLEKKFGDLVKEVDDIRDHKIVDIEGALTGLKKDFQKHTSSTWKNVAIGIIIGVLVATIITLLIHYNLPIRMR